MTDGRHETGDDYWHVFAKSGRWRIVRCKDDLQLIVQRRREGAPDGNRPWRAIAYVLNVSALCAVLQRPSLGVPVEDRDALVAGLGTIIATSADPVVAAATPRLAPEIEA